MKKRRSRFVKFPMMPNESERLAKHVFETVHRGACVTFNSKQSHGKGVYDFDVTYPDETRAALEVTESTDEYSLSILAQLAPRAKDGVIGPPRSKVLATACRHSWLVNPDPECKIASMRKGVDQYLSVIESEGITEFAAEPGLPMKESVLRIFRDLKIVEGLLLPGPLPACIWIGGPTQSIRGSIVGPEHLQRTVEYEAHKEDNRRKLRASECKERHLFVCFGSLNFDAWVALLVGLTPAQPPVLPAEVTHVWATTHEGNQDGILVWVAEAPNGWRNLGVIPRFLKLAMEVN